MNQGMKGHFDTAQLREAGRYSTTYRDVYGD